MSGDLTQITKNIRKARTQLANRVPNGKEGLAIIHIEYPTFLLLAKINGILTSSKDIINYFYNSINCYENIKSRGSKFTLKILYEEKVLFEGDISHKHLPD